MANGELRRRANTEIEKHGGIRGAARHEGVTHGMVARVRHGGNSPTLRRKWGIPKHPPRTRLNIKATVATIAAFDEQRGPQSRADYLLYLLALDVGELPY